MAYTNVGVSGGSGRDEDQLDLRDYARFLSRHWGKALAITAAFGAIAWATTALRPTVYDAQAVLAIHEDPDLPATGATIAKYRALVEDPAIPRRVVEDLGLNAAPDSVARMAARLSAPAVEGKVVAVDAQWEDAATAARAANSAARAVIALGNDRDRRAAATLRDVLKPELDGAERRLVDAEQALLAFERTHDVTAFRPDATTKVKRAEMLATVQADIEFERGNIASAELQLTKTPRMIGLLTDNGRGGRGDQILNPAYEELSRGIAASQVRLAGLQVEAKYLQEVGFGRGAGTTAEAEAQAGDLESDAARAQKVRDQVAERYRQAAADAVAPLPRLQLVDAAVPPDHAASKRVGMTTAVGLAAGLLLSLIGALIIWLVQPHETSL